MEQIYRIAGMTIGLQPLNEGLCDERLSAFRAEGKPDFTVSVTPEDLERGRREYRQLDLRLNRPTRERPVTLLEFKEFHRKIVEKAPFYGVFSFHGSAIAVDGQAYIFAARSGTGKSTHTRLWRELLGDRVLMINDDKPMLRVTGTQTIACGTPWNGKHKIGCNAEAPVRAVCFLERSAENRIREVPKSDVYPDLIRQVFHPEDPAAMAKVMELLGKMDVKYYRLGCNMEPEAARVAYEGMRG